MSLQDYRKKVESEPKKMEGPDFLKPDNVKVGDMVRVEKVEIQPKFTLDDGNEVPERPVVTGPFIAAGTVAEAQTVRVGISKGTAKKLFALWGDNWAGKKLMVTGTQKKTIEGREAKWIEWVGLP